MIDFRKELNPAQREAVETLDGPVLVIAGAGSGKTRTIVYRMANIVQQGHSPDSILLLTFTRKAAQEMLDRASLLLGAQGLYGVTGGTFHSFAYAWLRRYAEAMGAKNGLTVMDQSDAEGILRDIRDDLRLGKGDRSFPKRSTLLSLISKSRNKEMPIADILRGEAYHLSRYEDEIGLVAKGYESFKTRHGLLDYDDLLFGLERLLSDHAPALELARARYRFVMVDEFQDTNLVQARIVRLLAGDGGNVMAVGDDAQSIYAFRGANVHNILDFPNQFPGAKIIRLEQNYRSAQPVLDLTNAILEQAQLKFRKHLFSERKDGPLPQVFRTLSDRSQANAVVNKVLELSKKYPLHEIAVLFRAGYHSYPVEVALNKLGMRFQKFGGLRFSEAAHIKDVLGFMRLGQNPADVPSWQRVLSHIKGVGPKTVGRIYEAVLAGDNAHLAGVRRRSPEIGEVLDFLDEQRALGGTPAAMLARVLEFYTPILERKYPDDYPQRRSGLEQLERIASQYSDLEAFLGDISLENPQDEDERGKEHALVLSTVHSSKGLEWSVVLVIDLVQDRFPSRHALNSADDLEEERRLLYVACTRARDYLGLFVPSTVYNQYNHSSEPALESPFLAELPETVYESWRENFSGTMSRARDAAPAQALASPRSFGASAPAAPSAPATGKVPPSRLGYCRHKIFGRGKIVATVDGDKYRVNFPGFGLKVILANFLELE
ncbi:DNA helicase-2/ATP-dependent DNA helicase PcrA [Desulfobaculum xiamenense]|uniref:DNA 3'-5' helicase n=1 Tax=Desulfobaculum xiamenense TaxID=995050 RepID=A0A846QNT3_9BACT|nr:ATP-dependent helicase [Desulfobaculum xiamenense]NJB67933.1 DNA helicase-2/ATP-dependent DNA helicase PcrA [Desulfobaculum xiamenense]